MFHQSYPEHIRANFLFYTWIFKHLPLNIWQTKFTVNIITQNRYFSIDSFYRGCYILYFDKRYWNWILLQIKISFISIYFNYIHGILTFFPQFVTWLNKYQIQNHLSGTKLHLACLQIQNLFLHFTKARYVMFPENHCTTRHLLNIVWKRL